MQEGRFSYTGKVFVGRVKELYNAHQLIKKSRKSGLQKVLIRGKGGIGKTTFLRQIHDKISESTFSLYFRGRFNPVEFFRVLGTTYAGIISSICQWLTPGECAMLGRELPIFLPYIPVESVTDQKSSWSSAFIHCLSGLSNIRPVILLLDDFDNSLIPPELDMVLLFFSNKPITVFLVASQWPFDEGPDLEVTLSPFGLEETKELVRAINPTLSETQIKIIHKYSNGNPFYAKLFLENLEGMDFGDPFPEQINSLFRNKIYTGGKIGVRVLKTLAILPFQVKIKELETLFECISIRDILKKLLLQGVIEIHGDKVELSHSLYHEYIKNNLISKHDYEKIVESIASKVLRDNLMEDVDVGELLLNYTPNLQERRSYFRRLHTLAKRALILHDYETSKRYFIQAYKYLSACEEKEKRLNFLKDFAEFIVMFGEDGVIDFREIVRILVALPYHDRKRLLFEFASSLLLYGRFEDFEVVNKKFRWLIKTKDDKRLALLLKARWYAFYKKDKQKTLALLRESIEGVEDNKLRTKLLLNLIDFEANYGEEQQAFQRVLDLETTLRIKGSMLISGASAAIHLGKLQKAREWLDKIRHDFLYDLSPRGYLVYLTTEAIYSFVVGDLNRFDILIEQSRRDNKILGVPTYRQGIWELEVDKVIETGEVSRYHTLKKGFQQPVTMLEDPTIATLYKRLFDLWYLTETGKNEDAYLILKEIEREVLKSQFKSIHPFYFRIKGRVLWNLGHRKRAIRSWEKGKKILSSKQHLTHLMFYMRSIALTTKQKEHHNKWIKLAKEMGALDWINRYTGKIKKVVIPPQKIEVYALRELEIRLPWSAVSLRSSDFKYKKALDVLAILIASRGEYLRKWKILDCLWPECDKLNPLNVALSNLRTLIHHDAIETYDQRVRLNKNILWVDTWEFERLVKKGLKEPDLTLAGDYLHEAVDLYSGRFFNEMDVLDIDNYRNHLSFLLLRAYIKLSSICLTWRDYECSYNWGYKAVSLDPLNENAHRVYIMSLLGMGYRKLALNQYQRMVKMLKEELGVSPSPETQRLINVIKMGGTIVELHSQNP